MCVSPQGISPRLLNNADLYALTWDLGPLVNGQIFLLLSLLCFTPVLFTPWVNKREDRETQLLSLTHSHPHPFLSAYSLPTPHLGRVPPTAPSCCKSLLIHWFTHSWMSRKPRWVFRFQVLPFFLLLGCRLWPRASINRDGDTATKGSVKGTWGLFPPQESVSG